MVDESIKANIFAPGEYDTGFPDIHVIADTGLLEFDDNDHRNSVRYILKNAYDQILDGSVSISFSDQCECCMNILPNHDQSCSLEYYETGEPAMNLAELENSQDINWGEASEGWPDTAYTKEKLLLCSKEKIVPYGEYVVVRVQYTYPKEQSDGSYYDYSKARIRCSTINHIAALEDAAKAQEKYRGFKATSD